MICKFCGNEIEDGSDFCFICGQKVEADAPVSEPEVQAPVAAAAEAEAEAAVAVAPAENEAAEEPKTEEAAEEAPVDAKAAKKAAKKEKAGKFAKFIAFISVIIGLIMYSSAKKKGYEEKATAILNALMVGLNVKLVVVIGVLAKFFLLK